MKFKVKRFFWFAYNHLVYFVNVYFSPSAELKFKNNNLKII